MRALWTLMKVVIALAVAIPLCILALALGLGILGALIGIAIVTLKFAVLALIGWGVFRVLARLFGGPSVPRPKVASELPPVDRHYEAAMRELDRELGDVR